MAFTYLPLSANNKLARDDFDLIVARLTKAEEELRTIPAFAGIKDVDVLIAANPLPPFHPVSGMYFGAHIVWITVDPAHSFHYRDPRCAALTKSFDHECHHILRSQTVGRAGNLADALVTDGLALAFEMERGYPVSPYAINLTKNELLDSADRAREIILGGTDYVHQHWFFGTEGKKGLGPTLKHWTGYSLGFALSKLWLDQSINPETGEKYTAARAASLPTATILAPWLEQGRDYLASWPDEIALPNQPFIKGTASRIGDPSPR